MESTDPEGRPFCVDARAYQTPHGPLLPATGSGSSSRVWIGGKTLALLAVVLVVVLVALSSSPSASPQLASLRVLALQTSIRGTTQNIRQQSPKIQARPPVSHQNPKTSTRTNFISTFPQEESKSQPGLAANTESIPLTGSLPPRIQSPERLTSGFGFASVLSIVGLAVASIGLAVAKSRSHVQNQNALAIWNGQRFAMLAIDGEEVSNEKIRQMIQNSKIPSDRCIPDGSGDPSLIVRTNIDMGDRKMHFLMYASALLAEILRKDEKYVAVCVQDKQAMVFGGSDEPCALCSVASLGGINLENNAYISKGLSELLGDFDIPDDRYYITFDDYEMDNMGWKGRTFGG